MQSQFVDLGFEIFAASFPQDRSRQVSLSGWLDSLVLYTLHLTPARRLSGRVCMFLFLFRIELEIVEYWQ